MLTRIILAIALPLAWFSSGCLAQDRPPNIVIVFCDDLGYADVMDLAQGYETPNIDRLASEGMTFTSFYVSQPVCSASRASLLTGCYANRLGIHNALGPSARHGLHHDETTIAEITKQLGYANAIYGKWHLGHREPFLPTRHGFDEFIGIPYSNDMWPWHPEMSEEQRRLGQGWPILPFFHNETVINHEVTHADQHEFTKFFTDRAVHFINAHADRPFFLYVPHPQPHVPLFIKEGWAESTDQGLYADVVTELDKSLGEIMRALEAQGIRDDTIIMFSSDNGPWLGYGNHAGSAGPLREGKATTWEGGVRVPCVISWPGRIPAGAVTDEPVMTIDILPTLCEILGVDLPPLDIDGKSVMPILTGEPGAVSPHEAFYFYYRVNHLEAVRAGKWKLYLPHTYRTLEGGRVGADGMHGQYKNARTGVELYDLESDLGETTDLASTHPEIVEEMLVHVERARAELGDALTERKGSGTREPGRWNPDS